MHHFAYRDGALFAEAYFPLIGKDNARAGARELAFSAAVRSERAAVQGVEPGVGAGTVL